MIRVRTTEEMRRAVLDNAGTADVVIKAAAPLDFRPKSVAAQKIKKRSGALDRGVSSRRPDILKELGGSKNGTCAGRVCGRNREPCSRTAWKN